MGGDASGMSASGEFVDASGELLYASGMSVSTRRGWSRRMLTGGSRGWCDFHVKQGRERVEAVDLVDVVRRDLAVNEPTLDRPRGRVNNVDTLEDVEMSTLLSRLA